ncbi:MAG: hypothetical protein ACRDRU_23290 [Pseudonocardiaceae bacterium]
MRQYFGNGNTTDPVIQAASAIQETLAAWVDSIGVLPLLVVLGMLVLSAALLGRHRVARRR